jgi:hypothetical protein
MNQQRKAVEVSVSHTEAALARIEELRTMRNNIPDLSVELPPTGKGLATAASVSPEFVEATALARTNTPELVHGGAIPPEKLRELVTFASAYEAFANELDSLSSFVRLRVRQAKNVAGSEALTTYNLARRLAARPGMSQLKSQVASMRQALGRRFVRKAKPATPAPAPQPVTTEK